MSADDEQETSAAHAGFRLPGWMLVRTGETLSMPRLRQRLAAYI